MVYPGYLLNPGDMFQVEPERVLYATGAPKDREERRSSRLARRKPSAKKEADSETTSESSPAASGEAVPNTDPVKELSALRAQVKSIVSETSSPPAETSSSGLSADDQPCDVKSFVLQHHFERFPGRSTTRTHVPSQHQHQHRHSRETWSQEFGRLGSR